MRKSNPGYEQEFSYAASVLPTASFRNDSALKTCGTDSSVLGTSRLVPLRTGRRVKVLTVSGGRLSGLGGGGVPIERQETHD